MPWYNSIVPIYCQDTDTKKYQSVGTGFLVGFEGFRFLVTAAHVIKNLQGKKVFFYLANSMFENQLHWYTSPLSSDVSEKLDSIDIGVLPLPLSLELLTASLPFVTFDDYIKSVQLESNHFVALGFPQSENGKLFHSAMRHGQDFGPSKLAYFTHEVENTDEYPIYPYKLFESNFHIATELNKQGYKLINGVTVKNNTPDLHGMSGGLLLKGINHNPLTDRFSLAYPTGMILEKHASKPLFFSLRLNIIFSFLMANLNEWSFAVRQSPKLNIQLKK